MIISPRHRFVFVHIHKCAGTSIEVALSKRLGVNDIVIGSTGDGERHKGFFNDALKLKKHSSALDARRAIGPTQWDQFFKFAFVRHPVHRLRSLYTYALGLAARANPADTGGTSAKGPFRFKAVQAAVSSPDFDTFVRDPRTWLDPGSRPQWKSLCDEDGKVIVDFIGKVESIEKDWAKVMEYLPLNLSLGQQNASSNLAVSELSSEAKTIIEKNYAEDFALLHYDSSELHPSDAPAQPV